MTIEIVRGDCMDIMRKLKAGSVDLVFTSPPYNIGKAYEKRVSLRLYRDWMAVVVRETARLLRDGGSACWQVGSWVQGKHPKREYLPLDFMFIPLLEGCGLTLRHRVIWQFNSGLHARHHFSGRHETILWATKGKFRRGPGAAIERLGHVWSVPNVKHNHPEKTGHPAQFPEELVLRFVNELTKPGDLILDPFFGAGTVGAVAAKTGRRCIGIELEGKYVAMATERIRRGSPLFTEVKVAA